QVGKTMRNTAALKSIEALYKEAETVIGDGVPMVAIVKSAPPDAKPDIPVATRATPAADAPIADNSQPDTSTSGTSQKAKAQAAVFDRIEMLRSMAASLDDDLPERNLSENDRHEHDPAPAPSADPAASLPSSSLPSAPPVPAYETGSRQISDAELEDVVKKAVDDIVAVTPLDSVIAGNDRIESVMADIAEAVGKAETADMPDVPDTPNTPDAEPATSDITATPASPPAAPIDAPAETAVTSDTPLKLTTSIDLGNLNDIVASTVKSVIREELSNLVQSTVKSTLNELRTARDAQNDSSTSDR
ncbi:MAG: hypothetical protein ACPGOZ_05940, partial [Candidatus Puniceispirillum sp.]